MKLISKLHTSIYFMVCSSFLLSFCPDLDRDKIKYELRSDKMSYINSIQSDDKWIVGTVHGHQDQLYAEKMAISSLSLHIRSQVSEEIIQEIEEISSDKDEYFIFERTKASLSVITNETIWSHKSSLLKKMIIFLQ